MKREKQRDDKNPEWINFQISECFSRIDDAIANIIDPLLKREYIAYEQ